MKKFAAVTVPLLLLAVASDAGAQSISQGWTAYRAQQKTDPAAAAAVRGEPAEVAAAIVPSAQPVPPPVPAASAAPAVAPPPMQAQTAPAQWQPREREQPRGGFFVGAQAGAGWVYEDVDQRMLGLNAGYRWQTGPIAQVGVELAGGQLQDTDHQGWSYPGVNYASVGVNARINFGRDSAWFGIVRGGYWYAEPDKQTYFDYSYMDGGYAGLGIGVDINRHFNLQLMYTAYLYSNSYYYDYDDDGYRINRADVLSVGGEVRF